METGHFFVSYSRQQFYFTESLALFLQKQGVNVWFDVHRLTPGSDWQQSVRAGLDESAGLVLVASRAALASPYVRAEWEAAVAAHKPVYVALFEAVTLPPALREQPLIDCRSRFDSKAMLLAQAIRSGAAPHDRRPWPNPLRLPTRLPADLWLILVTLWSYALSGLALALLLVSWLLTFRIQSLDAAPSTLFLLIANTISVAFIAVYFLYTAVACTYRRRFEFQNLPLMLLGGWVLLWYPFRYFSNVSDAIAHDEINGLSATGFLGNVFIDERLHAVESALFNLLIFSALIQIVLSIVAVVVVLRSAALVRWLATGTAPRDRRIKANTRWLNAKWRAEAGPAPDGGEKTYRLRYDPAAEHIARDVRAALTAQSGGQGDLRESQDASTTYDIAILTNKTPRAWLDHLLQSTTTLVCVIGTSMRLPESAEQLRWAQWVDYRTRTFDQLRSMAFLLKYAPRVAENYPFPAVPEGLERNTYPVDIWWFSSSLRFVATVCVGAGVAWLVLLTWLNRPTGFSDPLLVLRVLGVLVIGLIAFWAADRVVHWNVTGAMALPLVGSVTGGVVLAALLFSAQASALATGFWVLAFLAVAMIIQTVRLLLRRSAVQDWLPVRIKPAGASAGPTLQAPAWKERGLTLWVYSFLILEYACTLLALTAPATS
jgi:TIR domain